MSKNLLVYSLLMNALIKAKEELQGKLKSISQLLEDDNKLTIKAADYFLKQEEEIKEAIEEFDNLINPIIKDYWTKHWAEVKKDK